MAVNARVDQFIFELGTLSVPNCRVDQFVFETAALFTPPVASCNNPPAGAVGTPYDHFLTASGGLAPYTWSIILGILPRGLALNASTGEISGIPTMPGLFPFTAQALDGNLAISTVNCSITIAGGPIRITLRGVNRRCAVCSDDVKVAEVPNLPPVKRAI